MLASTWALAELRGELDRRRRHVVELDVDQLEKADLAQGQTQKHSGASNLCDSGGSPPIFDTIIVMRALERLSEGERTGFLENLWERLSPEGRLIVCVPNEKCTDEARQAHAFSRRRLRRLLRGLGKPKLVKEQPFKWLVMYVDKSFAVSRSVQERYRVIADLCNGAVMELGCGPGELAKTIADRGLSVVGVDKNEGKIQQARRLHPDIEFIAANILSLPRLRRSFDTVVLSEVLEHVPEEAGNRMLSKAWRFVVPGGRLIVSVPNEDCVPHANHVREFDQKSLKSLLNRFGHPVVVTEQPFKYLLMYVDRHSG